MKAKYTARVYFDDEEIVDNTGDNLEELIAWMLSQAEENFGNYRGEIIDNETKKVVHSFRHAPPD